MQNNQQLIKTINECAAICQICAASCLSEENVKQLTKCIKLDLDCFDVCITTANLLARNSSISDKQLELCAEICRLCAEECEKHASKMDHCRKCAEACRKCEEACHSHV